MKMFEYIHKSAKLFGDNGGKAAFARYLQYFVLMSILSLITTFITNLASTNIDVQKNNR